MQAMDSMKVGRLASPWRRLMAALLEAIIASALQCAVWVPTGALGAILSPDNPNNPRNSDLAGALGLMGMLALCFVTLVFLAVQVFFWTKGTSLGKWLLGMQVVYEDGRPASLGTMLVREIIGKPISGLVFWLGYLWILLDGHHQGWHDKLVRTYVVMKGA